MTKHFLSNAQDADGHPNMEFERWYQQGLECWRARLPRNLVRQALRELTKRAELPGSDVHLWKLRAFCYGARGPSENHGQKQSVPAHYAWPQMTDPSWEFVVCVYPGESIEFDFVHPVSRRFWSEDNSPVDPPAAVPPLDMRWYLEMGFSVLRFDPGFAVTSAGLPTVRSHLRAIT